MRDINKEVFKMESIIFGKTAMRRKTLLVAIVKRNKCLISFFAFFLATFVLFNLLFPTSVFAATTYYASPSGSGTSCSLTSPCSLNTGLSYLAAGDTLYLRGGSYYQTVLFNRSGTSSAPITISGYPGETAVIDGEHIRPVTWGQLVRIEGNYTILKDVSVNRSNWMGLRVIGDHNMVSNVSASRNYENGIIGYQATNLTIDHSKSFENNYEWILGDLHDDNNWSSALTLHHCSNSVMTNNVVYGNGGEGIGVWYGSSNNRVENNISYDNWHMQAYIMNSSYTTFQGNIIYSSHSTGGTVSGLYIQDEDPSPLNTNNTVVNNLFYNNDPNIYWAHSEAGDGLINTTIAYNTFVNGKGIIWKRNIVIGDSGTHSNSVFKNNIILQEDSNYTDSAIGVSGITFSNNLWSKTPSSAVSGNGDVVGDPRLAKSGSTALGSLTSNYFRILDSSPAIDKATPISGISTDYFGTNRGSSPDIGAHEYTGGVITPTPTPALKPGDANGDGQVNEIDYTDYWLPNYNRNVIGRELSGDFNLDGLTDGVDYIIWFKNFGN